MRRPLFAVILLASGLPLRAAEPCVTLDDKAVSSLFDEWNFALSSLDAGLVAKRYWPDAVLLPTVSNTPRTDTAAIADYFQHFLAKRPRGRIDTRTIQNGCNLAVDMGTYTFSLMDDKGTTSEVPARYTFVYQYRDGAWRILHHHSSAMPETGTAAAMDAQASENSLANSKLAQSEPAKPAPRKQRRPKLKDYLEPEPVAAKPQDKPAATPVADTRLAAAEKPPAEVKAAAEANAPRAAKASVAAKPVPDSKPVADSKTSVPAPPPVETKPSPEIRTAMFANLTLSPPPSKFYPPEAARRKERGSVNLKVCSTGDGAVTDQMEIVKSSGSKLLDEAAMTWARAVTWVPATYDNHRVEGCAKVDVSFEPLPELAASRT